MKNLKKTQILHMNSKLIRVGEGRGTRPWISKYCQTCLQSTRKLQKRKEYERDIQKKRKIINFLQ
jgi:hypothetical protein